MAGWHQTIIIGNVGNVKELTYINGNVPVFNFSVAVTEKWNDKASGEKQEKTTWYNVTAWRGTAETLSKYVKKGMPIMLIGTVSVTAYKTKAGDVGASLNLTVDKFQFLGGGSQNSENRFGSDGYDDFAPPLGFEDVDF